MVASLIVAPDQTHPRSGPRLRLTPPKAVVECWRCAEDRRKVHPCRLIAPSGVLIVQVCGRCLASVPLDPDPRYVEVA